MKSLVTYYSRTGNNRRVAGEIAEALGAEVEELKENASREGRMGFVKAGADALRKRPAQLHKLTHDPADYDLVVIGGPCWASTICTPTRTYGIQQKEHFKRIAVFATAQDAGNARKAVDAMVDVVEIAPVATMALSDAEVAEDHAQRIADFVAALNGTAPHTPVA